MGYKYHQAVNIYNSALREELRTQMTRFQVLQGKISAIISDTDLQRFSDGTTTWYSQYANLALTVNQLNVDFSTFRTNYNQLDGRVNTLTSNVASYKASVDGFSADMQQVHRDYNTISTSVLDIEGNLSGVTSRLTTVESNYASTSWTETQISQSKDDILLSVSRSYINNFVIQYALGDNNTTAPTSGWTTTTPTWTIGKYIWQRVATTKPGSGTVYSTPICVQGEKGEPGQNGSQGVPGPRGETGPSGADAIQYYTWIKYADSPTSGMSDDPTNKLYLGLAVNKTTSTESTDYNDYGWTLIKGDRGLQGLPGTDGRTTYTWIKYATDSSGSNISDDPTGKEYIGLAYNKFTATESTNPADYTWSKFKGERGERGLQGLQGERGLQGIPGTNGTNGTDGKTSYFHIKYSNDGGQTFTANQGETVGSYIGTYVDYTAADSTNVSSYTWARFQGLPGDRGIPGTNGVNGQTSYLHIKYSNDGGQTFTANQGETPGSYIGQYTDFTPADSTNVSSYTWSKIEGEQGVSIATSYPQYILTNSNTTPPSQTASGWSNSPPTYVENNYYWMRIVNVMSDGTTVRSTPVLWQELNALETWRVSTDLKIADDHIISTVINSSSFGSKIEQWWNNITIAATKIRLEGYTTINDSFKIYNSGYVDIIGGNIAGWTIDEKRLRNASSNNLYQVYLATYNWNGTGTTNAIVVQSRSSTGENYKNRLELKYDGSIHSLGNFENRAFSTVINGGNFYCNGDITIGNVESNQDCIQMRMFLQDQSANFLRIRNFGVYNSGVYLYSVTARTNAYYITGISEGGDIGAGLDFRLGYTTGSSIRYKDDAGLLTEQKSFSIDDLYKIDVHMAKYKDWYLDPEDERYNKYYPMFIAEEIEKVYPLAVDHREGVPESWNEKVMIPIMFQMIKSQKETIDELTSKIDYLMNTSFK